MRRVTIGNDERRDILNYFGHTANHGIAANFYKLVYCCQSADDSTVLNDNVSCQSCHIGHDDIIADDAVVRYMCISHHQYVITQTSFISFTCRTVDSCTFTDSYAVANNSISFFAFEFQVLWFRTD
jgi:hypothetical protein